MDDNREKQLDKWKGEDKMTKKYKVTAQIRMVEYPDGNSKVQITKELDKDKPQHILFAGMIIESLAQELGFSVDKTIDLLKKNIKISPKNFSDEDRSSVKLKNRDIT